jgi:hypothetical protein
VTEAAPRWEDPLSTIQNTRSALAYGFAGHDLLHQPGERRDPGGGLAPTYHLPAVDVPGGQVGQGAAALVVVLDAHLAGLARGQGGVAAAAGLDGGLLIGADHVVAPAQRLTVQDPGVQVEHPGRLGREGGVADGDPGPVLPGLEGVSGQPPADRGRRGRDLAAGGQFAGQLGAAPPRQRQAGFGGQRARQRHRLGPVRGGEHRRAPASRGIFQPRQPGSSEPAAPLADRVHMHIQLHGDRGVGLAGGRCQHYPCPQPVAVGAAHRPGTSC